MAHPVDTSSRARELAGCEWARSWRRRARADLSPSMARGGEEEWGGGSCPGGRGLRPYRDRGGREQVEAGPARQRRVHDGSRTGAGGGGGWGRRQGEWAGLGCGGFAPGEV